MARGRNESLAKEAELAVLREQLGEMERRAQCSEEMRAEAAARTKSTGKEMSEAQRQHRAEVSRVREELALVKERWLAPEQREDLERAVRELESQLRSTREDLQRKRELLLSYKTEKEQDKSEAHALVAEIEQLKDDAEKIRRLTKESLRKEHALREMRTMLEALREGERKLLEENL